MRMKRLNKFLFLLAFSFGLFYGSAQAQTLSQIRTEVRRNLRDTDSTRQRYTDALLLDFINEAQREIVNATWLGEKTSSYILTPLTTFYSLPTDLIVITNVDFKDKQNTTLPLTEMTLKGLNSENPDWRRTVGTPLDYYVDKATTSNQLVISYIPIPTTQSTGTVTVRYYYQVPDLAADADVPFDGKRHLYFYHQVIVYHATMRLKMIEKKIEEANFYATMYGNYLKIIRERLGDIPNYNPSIGVSGAR